MSAKRETPATKWHRGAFALGAALAGCGGNDRPAREAEIPQLPIAQPVISTPARVGSDTEPVATAPAPTPTASASLDEPLPSSDPARGRFSIADATAGLEGAGPLTATVKTSMGSFQCALFEDKAPITVANFVGLARGTRPYKSEVDGEWVKKPAYDGTTFHRIIKGFMIQGGDRRGNGTGEPGYVIPDEIWAGAKHDRAGLLCMANRGPNTNGAQFFVTDAPAFALDGKYTIFGECAPVSVIHAIAASPRSADDRPLTPVTIETVTISRGARPGAGG